MAGKLAGSSGRRPPSVSHDDLIVAIVGELAADDRQLQAFVAETGQDPAELRRGLTQRSVQKGLLAFLAGNDPLIRAVARAVQRSPEEIAAVALRAIQEPDNGYF